MDKNLKLMKAVKNNIDSFESKLARFSLVYCSTPNTTTGESPAELLFHQPISKQTQLEMPSFHNIC